MRGAYLLACSFSVLLVAACDGGKTQTFIDGGDEQIDAHVNDARLEIDRGNADLGMIILGESSPPLTLHVTNEGNDRSGGVTVTVTGAGFRKTRDTCSDQTLDADEECEIDVVATANDPGAFA